MNSVKSFLTGAVVLVAVALVLASLSCSATPTAPTSAPVAKQAEPAKVPAAPTAAPTAAQAQAAAPTAAEIIKVGIATSMTGPAARIGITDERLIRMAIADVNAKGGFKVGGKTYKFDAVTADDKNTSDGGREAANKLVLADKVAFVVGPTSSGTAGAQTVTGPNNILLLATTAQDVALGTKFPLTMVAGIANVRMRSPAMYEWLAKERPNAKRLFVVTSGDAAGQGYLPVIDDVAKDKGLTIIAKEIVPTDTKDLNPLAVRIVRENPDMIDLGAMGAMPALFSGLMKSLYDQGYRNPVLAFTIDMVTFRSGGPAMQGVVSGVLSDYMGPALSDKQKQIIQRYIQQYGESEFEPTGLGSYDQPWILAQALEKAGALVDGQKMAEILRAGEWDVMAGKAKFVGTKVFGLASVLEQPVYMSRVEKDKVVTFQSFKGTLP